METDPQQELRAKESRHEKAKKMQKGNFERGDCIRRTTADHDRLEIHAPSSMNRTREAKGRDDVVHFFQQVHRTYRVFRLSRTLPKE